MDNNFTHIAPVHELAAYIRARRLVRPRVLPEAAVAHGLALPADLQHCMCECAYTQNILEQNELRLLVIQPP